MIEVREFFGAFRGAGKGKTVISNLPELPCEEALLLNLNPSLFTFIGGNVYISQMTLLINDGNAMRLWPISESIYGELTSLFTFIGL
ncbi:MAG: hypothetical protein U5K79_24175 [Cyclobacteriaceae bacterium]|nr:hypothetical protein [Cyclobacteriaceae bacterium]